LSFAIGSYVTVLALPAIEVPSVTIRTASGVEKKIEEMKGLKKRGLYKGEATIKGRYLEGVTATSRFVGDVVTVGVNIEDQKK
jgi:hypothetical protein